MRFLILTISFLAITISSQAQKEFEGSVNFSLISPTSDTIKTIWSYKKGNYRLDYINHPYLEYEFVNKKKGLTYAKFKNVDSLFYSSVSSDSVKLTNYSKNKTEDEINGFKITNVMSINFKSKEENMTKTIFYNPSLIRIHKKSFEYHKLQHFDFTYSHLKSVPIRVINKLGNLVQVFEMSSYESKKINKLIFKPIKMIPIAKY